MAVFRLGLIGGGRMGRTHLRALSSSEHVRIVAVADPSPEVRDALGGAGLTVFRDVEALLQAGRLDGVLIAAPSGRHLDLVAQVAAAGLPILCEKPCGLTSAEAREAAGIATAAGVYLQVAYLAPFRARTAIAAPADCRRGTGRHLFRRLLSVGRHAAAA